MLRFLAQRLRMSCLSSWNPLIAIVGATGTGKSQLAVTLAECFNGEVINADALQMYKGLPIATNKITTEEEKGVPHHLLGCIGLEEEPWTVGKFVGEAENTINEIRRRGKLPILVGGTHYYTQSVLFQNVVLDKKEVLPSAEELEIKWPILAGSNEEMREELRKVDPQMAARWHPRDKRKIRRSLQIWLETGKRASEIYAEQKSPQPEALSATSHIDANGDVFSGHSPLRYDTLLFWLYEDADILNKRLDSRVEVMVAQGLLAEVKTMDIVHRELIQSGLTVDLTRGIWVAIGYKEFNGYLEALRAGLDEVHLAKSIKAGIELTQIATRQYARRQNRWIRLKMIPALRNAQASDKFFLLDRSNNSVSLESTACNLAEAFLAKAILPIPQSLSLGAARILEPNTDSTPREAAMYARHCDLCGITVVTEKSWQDHLSSRKHKGLLKPPSERRHRDASGLRPSVHVDSHEI